MNIDTIFDDYPFLKLHRSTSLLQYPVSSKFLDMLIKLGKFLPKYTVSDTAKLR